MTPTSKSAETDSGHQGDTTTTIAEIRLREADRYELALLLLVAHSSYSHCKGFGENRKIRAEPSRVAHRVARRRWRAPRVRVRLEYPAQTSRLGR